MVGSGSQDGTARLWRCDGTADPRILDKSGNCYVIAWSPDGGQIATPGADHTIRLWKPDGRPGPVLTGHNDTILASPGARTATGLPRAT